MRCENKTFLQNDPGFLQEISSTAVEVGLAQAVESSYVSISFCRDRDRGLELGLSLRRDRLEQRPAKETLQPARDRDTSGKSTSR